MCVVVPRQSWQGGPLRAPVASPRPGGPSNEPVADPGQPGNWGLFSGPQHRLAGAPPVRKPSRSPTPHDQPCDCWTSRQPFAGWMPAGLSRPCTTTMGSQLPSTLDQALTHPEPVPALPRWTRTRDGPSTPSAMELFIRRQSQVRLALTFSISSPRWRRMRKSSTNTALGTAVP